MRPLLAAEVLLIRGVLVHTSIFGATFSYQSWSFRCVARFCPCVNIVSGWVRWMIVLKNPS